MNHSSKSLSDKALLDILALSTDATAIYTTANIIIELANDAMINFWGKDRSVIGKPLEEAVPELKDQEFINILKNVWHTGNTYEAKERPAQLNVNGILQTFYFDFIYRAIRNEDGSTYCILHSAVDATSRVLNSNAMRQSEERQAFLLRLSDSLRPLADAGLIQKEAARVIGEYLHASRVGYGDVSDQRWFRTDHNWTNGTVPEHLGTHDLEAFGPDAISAFRQGINLVIGDVFTDERTATPELHAAFSALQIQAVITVSLVKENRFVAAFYVHDSKPRQWQAEEILLIEKVAERTWAAVERAHAEVALRESESRYRTLFNSIDEAFMLIELIHDENGRAIDYRMLDINPAFEQQTGLGSSLGKTVRELIPDVEQFWIDGYGEVAKTGQAMRFENYNQSTDRWYSVYASSVAQNSNLVVVVFADITERKREEQRKNDFISMASHELKTPLTSAKAYVQMLGAKAKQAQDAFTENALNKVDLQINKMQALIKGFLDVARLESGKIELNLQPFILNGLIIEIIDEISLTINTHTIILDPFDPLSVTADKDKIGQVIHNFLSNAVKYSPKDTSIQVQCHCTDDYVTISVTDEGLGIKPQDIPKLFERFYRVESQQTQNIAGFGIGLYLCAEIVEQHHGKIGASSTLGKGSTFWFTLPLNITDDNS